MDDDDDSCPFLDIDFSEIDDDTSLTKEEKDELKKKMIIEAVGEMPNEEDWQCVKSYDSENDEPIYDELTDIPKLPDVIKFVRDNMVREMHIYTSLCVHLYAIVYPAHTCPICI